MKRILFSLLISIFFINSQAASLANIASNRANQLYPEDVVAISSLLTLTTITSPLLGLILIVDGQESGKLNYSHEDALDKLKFSCENKSEINSAEYVSQFFSDLSKARIVSIDNEKFDCEIEERDCIGQAVIDLAKEFSLSDRSLYLDCYNGALKK